MTQFSVLLQLLEVAEQVVISTTTDQPEVLVEVVVEVAQEVQELQVKEIVEAILLMVLKVLQAVAAVLRAQEELLLVEVGQLLQVVMRATVVTEPHLHYQEHQ